MSSTVALARDFSEHGLKACEVELVGLTGETIALITVARDDIPPVGRREIAQAPRGGVGSPLTVRDGKRGAAAARPEMKSIGKPAREDRQRGSMRQGRDAGPEMAPDYLSSALPGRAWAKRT